MGHIVHSGVSGVGNIDALFFMLGWAGAVSVKSVSGHLMPNLYFCICWDLRVTYCIPVRQCRETLMHYFSCSGGTGTDSTKVHRDTLC
jgi:hypothetical protein